MDLTHSTVSSRAGRSPALVGAELHGSGFPRTSLDGPTHSVPRTSALTFMVVKTEQLCMWYQQGPWHLVRVQVRWMGGQGHLSPPALGTLPTVLGQNDAHGVSGSAFFATMYLLYSQLSQRKENSSHLHKSIVNQCLSKTTIYI